VFLLGELRPACSLRFDLAQRADGSVNFSLRRQAQSVVVDRTPLCWILLLRKISQEYFFVSVLRFILMYDTKLTDSAGIALYFRLLIKKDFLVPQNLHDVLQPGPFDHP
jgi:hypothetical protein